MTNKTKIENLEDLIKDSIGGEVVEQKMESLLPPGENYGSVMYKVDFKVKKDDKQAEYHAVAKCTPTNTATQEFFNSQETFKSEIAWYTTIIPTLKQFQRDHGVQKVIDFFQTFYGARISLDPESDQVDLDGVMLTQNLKYLGYYNIDRHIGFDLDTTYNILRDLATFHAVPLAIRLQNPALFDKNIRPYLSRFRDFDPEMLEGFNKQVIHVFTKIPECHSLLDRIKQHVDYGKVIGGRPIREPWTTVIHMDFWMNNIMITGGKDSKIIVLDLQFPCLGSPAADLVLFLLTSVKLDVIRDKFDDFVEYYYQQFTKNLQELHIPTENYSFEGLLREIETETRFSEFTHALDHSFMILGEKGQSAFESPDEDSKKEDTAVAIVDPNEMHIEKFRWIATEAAKRKWI